MIKIDFDKLQKEVADKNWIDGKKVKNYLGKNNNMGSKKTGRNKDD
jgi:hypothetical protein